MAKISALVIPAVIDTSGIDRGISSIKNKMSRVRGGGSGIGGGGAGFSSGVTPFGGGGDIGGAAMAAAFGLAAGQRSRVQASIHQRGSFTGMNVPNPAITRKYSMADGTPIRPTHFNFSEKWTNASNMLASWKSGRSMIATDFYKLRAQQSGSAHDEMRYQQRAAIRDRRFQDEKFALSRFGKASYAAGRGYGILENTLSNKLVAGAGFGVAAYSMLRGAGSRNMEQRSSDIRRFQGTPYYTAARNLKADYYNTSTPTASQGFFMGGRMGTGGRAPLAERAYTALGDVPGGVATAAGLALGGAEAALVGTKEEQAASLKATQDFYSGTNVSMGGPLVIGLEKLFRKIFM